MAVTSAVRLVAGLITILVVSGCTDSDGEESTAPTAPSATLPTVSPQPLEPEAERMLDDVEHLADEIGPRHATSAEYERAADWVAERFEELGYDVSRQSIDVPAGNTWGVDVEAGEADNVIASPTGFDPTQEHRVVGAHLDTIPVAPGAEDNASGVAVMLELARLHAASDVPVRFIAFGAEEPRGPGDDLHHFGSQTYAGSLDAAERDAMLAMVALDRVGVPGDLPICHGGRGPTDVRDALAEAAQDADVPHSVCDDNRTSDHWSFERADLTAARLGSLPYAGYHSADDVPSVVEADQLQRAGEVMTTWLEGLD